MIEDILKTYVTIKGALEKRPDHTRPHPYNINENELHLFDLNKTPWIAALLTIAWTIRSGQQ